MPKQKTRNWIFSAIFILGTLLRIWHLDSSELTFDEGLYAFRGIGYFDYLESNLQPTPVQWLADKNLPAWTHLSFHDHPPLFFAIQYIFFSIFGTSLFAARLPSVLAGLASIYIIYLIGKKIFSHTDQKEKIFSLPHSEFFGLSAALLLALNSAHLLLSRLSMMESLSFFLIWLNLYFFIKLLEYQKYWFIFGITLGLNFLTKYTSFILPLAYFVFLLITKSPLLKSKKVYLSLFVAILIFSPVIIYNIYLYNLSGHLDLQFSSLLDLKTPEWQGDSGKTQEPFSNLFENLFSTYSIPFLLVCAVGILVMFISKKSGEEKIMEKKMNWLLLLLMLFITLLLTRIGSAIRFSSLYLIPGIFLAMTSVIILFERIKNKTLAGILFASLLLFELYFSVNLLFLHPADYGVVKLDNYIESIVNNARLADGLPTDPNPHINKVIQSHAATHPATLPKMGFVYDENLSLTARLWTLSRRQYYQGIPIMPSNAFLTLLNSENIQTLKGFKIYFVKTESAAPQIGTHATYADNLEKIMIEKNLIPEIIHAQNNLPAFSLYTFSIE